MPHLSLPCVSYSVLSFVLRSSEARKTSCCVLWIVPSNKKERKERKTIASQINKKPKTPAVTTTTPQHRETSQLQAAQDKLKSPPSLQSTNNLPSGTSELMIAVTDLMV